MKFARSKYGPRLHATVSYWKYQLGLTLGKIKKLLLESYGLSLSTGQLSQMLHRSKQEFQRMYQDLKGKLGEQSVLYADETGWKQSGKNAWLWSFSSPTMSYYHIDKNRGQKVV